MRAGSASNSPWPSRTLDRSTESLLCLTRRHLEIDGTELLDILQLLYIVIGQFGSAFAKFFLCQASVFVAEAAAGLHMGQAFLMIFHTGRFLDMIV